MHNRQRIDKQGLLIKYAGLPPGLHSSKREKRDYRRVKAAAEHLIRTCSKSKPRTSEREPASAAVGKCVDAYIDGTYNPRNPLSRRRRRLVINAKTFGRLKHIREEFLKAKESRENVGVKKKEVELRDLSEESTLKAAFECVIRYEGAKIPGIVLPRSEVTNLRDCFKSNGIPLPKKNAECVELKGYKLFNSWYGYDYSSQYVLVSACKKSCGGGLSTHIRYLRAPVPAVLGALGSDLLKDVFLKLSMGAMAARVVPVRAMLRALACAAAFAGGFFVGKAIDEGVGIFTSRKLSDHIGHSLGEKARAPGWMMKAYDWVSDLF